MHCLQHVAAVPLGAGGAGGDVDTLCLQAVDDALRTKTGKREVYNVRRCLLPDEDEPRNFLRAGAAVVSKVRHTGNLLLRVGGGAGGGKAADAGQILRAGAEIALLSAAVDEGRQRKTRTDVERAHTLGTVDFMPRDGNQVRAERLCLEGDFQEALDGVGVKKSQRAEPAGDADHIRNRHDGARLVVDHHDGNENRIRAKGSFERVGADEACFIRLQICDLEALRFERFHGVQHGVMLDGSGDDVIAALFQALAGRENCPVIRLRAAGGEKDAVRLSAETGSNLLAGVFQLALGGNAQLVNRGGVSPGVAQQARHCLHAGGIWFGGGGIVQIDHRNTSALF